MDSFSVDGIWEIDIFARFYGTGTENRGKTDISTGIVWMGTESQEFHGNHLRGSGKSIFVRELFGWDHGNDIRTGTGINRTFREILREFSQGLP